ncbi:Mpo1-like protein [Pseudanabaena sp. BC1403]|uniref:Mpo1-like protein n=1 Tax=Pseudanabaena sp. BC1403 TaxID=2043171 RepID=UPI000CD90245|nr:Mpo1-like protein [Pseudanabaena sp. BC1403]
MSIPKLLQWQWNGYLRYHKSKRNLLLHIIFVPLFLAANLGLLLALFNVSLSACVLCIVFMTLSIVLQGKGHSIEENSAEPFSSPLNAIVRIFLEQWITFPRFVLTGYWFSALQDSSKTSKTS